MSARELAMEILEEENRERPDVVRLARALSVAARVDPALLRRLRTRLFPEMDPGAESDVWFSPLVESAGYGGFVLDSEVAGVLRESLAADHRRHAGPPGSSLLSRVEAVLAEVHGVRLPSIWAEEQATVMALRGDPPEAMEAVLRPAVKAMLESGERGMEVARWALRALPRLPEAARRTEAAAMLALGASARLGGRAVAAAPDADGAALSPHLAWALPPETLSARTELSVRLLRGGIEFLAPDAELPVVSLPRTHPLLVQLSWSTPGASGRKLAQAQAGRTVELPEAVDGVTLRTLAGDEYDLRAAGPGASGEPAPTLDERYAWAVDALVRVGSSQDRESQVTGWIPAPGRVVTAASPFPEGVPYLHVIWRDRHTPARVVARDHETNLLLLELVEPPDDARLSLTPLPDAFTWMEAGQLLTVLAFHQGQPFSLELRFRHSTGQDAEAEFTAPGGFPNRDSEALMEAPVLMGQVTVGYVWGFFGLVTPVEEEDRVHSVIVRDAGAVLRLLQAPAEAGETPRQSAPEEQERIVVLDFTTTYSRRQERQRALAERLTAIGLYPATIVDPVGQLNRSGPQEFWRFIGNEERLLFYCDENTFGRPDAQWIAQAVAWMHRTSARIAAITLVVTEPPIPESAHGEPWSWLGKPIALSDGTRLLAALVDQKPRPSFGPVDPAVFLLATRLRDFPANALASVATSELWGELPPAPTNEFPAFEVASRMVLAGLGGSMAALLELRPFARGPGVMENILRLAASSAISVLMTNALRSAARRPPGTRIAVLDAHLVHTAEMLADRAGHYGGDWRWVTLPEPSPDAFRRAFGERFRGDPEQVLEELESREANLVAIVGPGHSGPVWEVAMEFRDQFPTVVLLVLSDEAAAPEAVRPEVVPAPGREQEVEWYHDYRTALEAIDDGLSGNSFAEG